MSGIQNSSLSDEEFERAVYMTLRMGALPPEVVKELVTRNANGGRDKERTQSSNNPNQLPLPFNE